MALVAPPLTLPLSPSGQGLSASLFHLSESNSTHADKDWVQDQEEKRQVMIIGVLVSILFVISDGD